MLISANATILGNIVVGEGSMVGAGSLVLKEVAPHTMCAGIPGKEIGRIVYGDEPAALMTQDFCAALSEVSPQPFFLLLFLPRTDRFLRELLVAC